MSSAISPSAWTVHAACAATLAVGKPISRISQPCLGTWVAMPPRFTLDSYSSPIRPVSRSRILVARARQGDARALTSIQSTARYLGLGLANVVNGLNPARVFLTGEITTAWDLIEGTVREGLKERSLTEALAATRVHVASSVENPRLRGAAALVAAPTFAAIRVA